MPLYAIPNARVVHHFMPEMPLRVSALRSLGALYERVFDRELHGRTGPGRRARPGRFPAAITCDDPRASEVVRRAADRFGWSAFDRQPGRGRGFAFARYKNLAAYLAVAISSVGSIAKAAGCGCCAPVAAVDSGEAVNPDGIVNQIEGGILQSASWTLYESVHFDRTRITSRDWSSYPIMRFSAAPDTVDVQSSIGPASLSSAPAKPRKARPPPPSPTRSPMPSASACATSR